MPISVKWDNDDKTIVVLRHMGRWTWEEYYSAVQQSTYLIDEVAHQVDMISHFADPDALMPPAGSFFHWQKTLTEAPPNLGIIIMVPGNTFIRNFVSVSQRILGEMVGSRLRTAESIERARSISQERRLDESSNPGC